MSAYRISRSRGGAAHEVSTVTLKGGESDAETALVPARAVRTAPASHMMVDFGVGAAVDNVEMAMESVAKHVTGHAECGVSNRALLAGNRGQSWKPAGIGWR